MAHRVMLCANVFATAKDTHNVSYDDQELVQSDDGYLKFTRMCFFVVERGNHQRYVEDLLLLKHRLCRHGSYLVADRETDCYVSLDRLQIENVIRTIAVRVERMMMQSSHRKKISFVATCEVILVRHGQPWQREATPGSAVFSDFGIVPLIEVAVDVIKKRKRDGGFDDDDLKWKTELD
ncbi:hypothetical protein ACJRO7_016847 [Eucalyptus globulus]|uniref:Uncharacterized protein n=1 Tax=Eucalyptus globulus TaxID=34317 RepID=A0ABD3KUL9_EUCGL